MMATDPTQMQWRPSQYNKFMGPRQQPARDLFSRIAHYQPKSITDLGCGSGEITQLLSQHWPEAAVCGFDRSGEMLASAATLSDDITWQQGDIASWQPDQPQELIFSNAALHWVDDHTTLFPHLLAQLPPGGLLAVQMPRNFTQPTHQLLFETAQEAPWRATTEPLIRRDPVGSAAYYYDLLHPLCEEITLWESHYCHVLEGENPVLAWTRGTVLGPYLEALQGDQRAHFAQRYGNKLLAAYPKQADGKTLLTYRRLFMIVKK
uniref:Trans-aconitate 2-methyltransferase n=1 Tax=Magnetococcus massalia (strain MO-1) TaxID=451514 RepID=A0A1S7LPJ4_MAGMO|nr:Trans-aconitate 2-methyltransferase [Candidatus Magnetococcus massalia]